MDAIRMPSNEQGSRLVTTPMAILSDSARLALEAGIPMFELKKETRNFVGSNDFGYHNVRVTEHVNEINNRLSYRTKWFKGPEAYVKYNPDKRGFCFGFCPDDPAWFNRIKLASNILGGNFTIVRYHTVNGILPQKRITDEILFFGDLIHEWNVIVGDDVVFRTKSRDEALSEKRKREADGENAQALRNKVEPIQKLIKIHRSRWVFSSEFQNDILPQLKQEIVKKFDTEREAQKNMLKDALSNLSPEEKREILLGGSNEAQNTGNTEPLPENVAIEDLSIQQARTMAKRHGINTNGMKLDDIKKALMSKLVGAKDEPNSKEIVEEDF